MVLNQIQSYVVKYFRLPYYLSSATYSALSALATRSAETQMLDLQRPVTQLARPFRPTGGHGFARGSLGLKKIQECQTVCSQSRLFVLRAMRQITRIDQNYKTTTTTTTIDTVQYHHRLRSGTRMLNENRE